MNILCEDPTFCSAYNDKSKYLCNTCLKALQEEARVNTRPFTSEEEKEIQKFLDENRDFMQDLIKRGD
jgi:hypothetical protein